MNNKSKKAPKVSANLNRSALQSLRDQAETLLQKRGGTNKRNRTSNPNALAVYTDAPVSRGFTVKNNTPRFRQMSNGVIRLNHREYLADIGSRATYKYAINPGIPETFKWLSSIARSFESYQFNKLVFHYLPSSSTSRDGTIAMAIDYDVLDAAPVNKQALLAYKSSTRAAVWQSSSMVVQNSDMMTLGKRRYTRSEFVSGDLKTYDIGNLYIILESTLTQLGELWVESDVTLYTPQPIPAPGPSYTFVPGRTGTDSTPDAFRKVASAPKTGRSLVMNYIAGFTYIQNLIAGRRYLLTGLVESMGATVDNVLAIAADGQDPATRFANAVYNTTQVNNDPAYIMFSYAFDYLRNDSSGDGMRLAFRDTTGSTPFPDLAFLDNLQITEVIGSAIQ